MTPTPPTCAVIQNAQQATGLAADLQKAIRRYIRSKKLCDQCQLVDECIARTEVQTAINTVLQSVNDEWSALYDA